MADLSTAWGILHKDSFADLRGQIEMGMWTTARDHLSAGATGLAGDHAIRTLRGDTAPIDVAIRTVACDMTIQQKIIDSGYELDDASLTVFLNEQWGQMAGVVAGNLTQAAS
jgi:hypothetical protein